MDRWAELDLLTKVLKENESITQRAVRGSSMLINDNTGYFKLG